MSLFVLNKRYNIIRLFSLLAIVVFVPNFFLNDAKTTTSTSNDEQVYKIAHNIISYPRNISPPKTNINNIFWLHIPKCGTSFFNTIYLNFCPNILKSNHQLLSHEKPFMDGYLIKNFPSQTWCPNVKFYNSPNVGFHCPYLEQRHDQQFITLAMLRDPIERLISAFSFRKHTKLKVPHYSKLMDPNITLEQYAMEPHIPNCQIKMVLGFHCNDEVPSHQLNLKKALERIGSPNFFFGFTDRWEESICLFHKWFGGSTAKYELKNNRPTKRIDVTLSSDIIEDMDTFFVRGALRVFEERLRKTGCLFPQF